MRPLPASMLIILSVFTLSACLVGDPTRDGRTDDGKEDDGGVKVDPARPTCIDGMQNGDEIGVDCGGGCSAMCDDVFARDDDTLAVFELNNDLTDGSGAGRDATLLGGSFVATAWGAGLALDGTANQGFDWSLYADRLVYPYTVEMVVMPAATSCYRKLFSPSDTRDNGWYLCNGVELFPGGAAPTTMVAGERLYLAFVSLSANRVDVYVRGVKVATIAGGFSGPTDAVFFRDDTSTSRQESFRGVVDAVRLSTGARTADEIAAIEKRLDEQP